MLFLSLIGDAADIFELAFHRRALSHRRTPVKFNTAY